MKKNRKKIKLPEFEFGTYVTNPGVDLAEANIALAQAKAAGSNNPWAMGTKVLGNLAMQYGGSMMNKGASAGEGISSGGFNWGNLLQTGVGALGAYGNAQGSFATGGKVGIPTAINAEGEEVIETPNGAVGTLKGPSHAEGGIDMVVPSGTEIFSKKIKGSDGKTMAERKLEREKKISKIEKQLEKNPNDATLLRTLKRLQSNNEKKEQSDMAVMQLAKMVSEAEQFATGGVAGWPPMNMDWNKLFSSMNPSLNMTGTTDDFHTGNNAMDYGVSTTGTPATTYSPSTNPTGVASTGDNTSPWMGALNITAGDAVGLFGNLVSTFGPMRNTNNMRASDTPNINPFLNYGKEGIDKMDQTKGFASGVRDSQLQDLELARNATINRGRNGARSINTMRALDLATDMGVNNTRSQIYNQYMQQIASILGQEAMMENDQDRMVMSGEAQRDAADRADKDAYFTALASDISTMGTGLQKTGRDLNQMKTRNVTGNVLNQMYPNFEVDMMNGKLTGKVTEEQVKSTSIYSNLPTTELKDKYLNGIIKKNYKWVGGKLYNKEGKELDITTLEPIK